MRQFICLVLLPLLLCACTSTPGKKEDKYWHAAKIAAQDPLTWAPLAAAAVIAATDQDQQISDDLSSKTPIFSNQENANSQSDRMKNVLKLSAIMSAAFLPENYQSKYLTGNFFTLLSVQGATDQIKSIADRERPNGEDRESFPSGHTSQAFAAARIVHDNLALYDNLSEDSKNVLNVTAYSMAVGTAWARMEAQRHYPTDVLVGAAFGNFMATFFNEAFLNESNMRMNVGIDPDVDVLMVSLNWRF